MARTWKVEESNEKLDFMEFKSTATENSNNVSFQSMSFQSCFCTGGHLVMHSEGGGKPRESP